MRFSEHAAKGTAKEKISSPLVRAGIRSSGVAAISADCSQQGTRIEVTLETHAQVLQASILSCNPPRSAAGPGPVVRSTAPYRSACVRHSAHNTNRRGRRVFLPWGFHRDGGARTRGFQGRETVAGAVECAAVTKRCEAILYATCTRAWDRERGQACTVILMSCPNSSRKRISRSREKPERRPRRRAETLG